MVGRMAASTAARLLLQARHIRGRRCIYVRELGCFSFSYHIEVNLCEVEQERISSRRVLVHLQLPELLPSHVSQHINIIDLLHLFLLLYHGISVIGKKYKSVK